MTKIKDLNFIDIGLPSGNKICADLVNNFYNARELYRTCRSFLPTINEIKEILLFCKIEPTTIQYESDDDTIKEVNCINVIGLKQHFFIPFLGKIDSINDDIISNEGVSATLLTCIESDDSISTITFFNDRVDPNSIAYDNDYVQTILIKRDV